MYACMQCHIECVREILSANANVNMSNVDGHTALMYACIKGHKACVQELLKANADVSARDDDGNTALTYVLTNCDREIPTEECLVCVRELIKAGAELGTTELQEGRESSVAEVQARLSLSLLNTEAFDVVTSHSEICIGLPATVHDNDRKHQTLQIHGSVVRDERGVALGIENLEALQYECEVSEQHVAAMHGDIERLQGLIDSKSDIDTKDKDGVTCLMLASMHGHVGTVELLLKAKAKPESVDNSNNTSLIYACKHGHAQVSELLLPSTKAAGALEIKNKFSGMTARMWASHNEMLIMLQILDAAGAKPAPAMDDPNMLPFPLSVRQVPDLEYKAELQQSVELMNTGTEIIVNPHSLRAEMHADEAIFEFSLDSCGERNFLHSYARKISNPPLAHFLPSAFAS